MGLAAGGTSVWRRRSDSREHPADGLASPLCSTHQRISTAAPNFARPTSAIREGAPVDATRLFRQLRTAVCHSVSCRLLAAHGAGERQRAPGGKTNARHPCEPVAHRDRLFQKNDRHVLILPCRESVVSRKPAFG